MSIYYYNCYFYGEFNAVGGGKVAGVVNVVCGDAHIYKNHIDFAKQLLTRNSYPYPKLIIKNKLKNIEDFTYDDLILIDYKSHPNIKAPMAI